MQEQSPQRWAGERLGLKEAGIGSLASTPRRAAAICIDWASAMLISSAFFKGDSTATLLVFAVLQVAFIGVLGFSVGHRFMGLRLVKTDLRSMPGIFAALIRTLLLCLVIPAAVWDADNRGLHDKAARTILIRGF